MMIAKPVEVRGRHVRRVRLGVEKVDTVMTRGILIDVAASRTPIPPAVGLRPSDPPGGQRLHRLVNMKLDELAAKRAHEFALLLQPLKIQGGGSTVAPVAIR
jgi:hypothetical protein